MRKLIAATAIGGAVLSGSLLGSGTASAHTSNEWEFINDTYGIGMTHSWGNAGILDDGYIACSQLRAGWSNYAVANEMFLNSTYAQGPYEGVAFWQAQNFVNSANAHLCPFA